MVAPLTDSATWAEQRGRAAIGGTRKNSSYRNLSMVIGGGGAGSARLKPCAASHVDASLPLSARS